MVCGLDVHKKFDSETTARSDRKYCVKCKEDNAQKDNWEMEYIK
jgi:hypothetical protein